MRTAITPLNLDATVSLLLETATSELRGYLCVANVHTITLAARESYFGEVLNNATAVVADGMPIVWRARSAGYSEIGRVYGADLMVAACAAGIPQGVRHGFFGGMEGVPETIACRLKQHHPSIQIAGVWNPGAIAAGEKSSPELLDEINESECDILWVGLGAPKQEIWMAQHRPALNVPVLVGVGQAFDIIAGRRLRPPSWMAGNGMEWLYRLVHEPGRLWKRYAIYNSLFLWYLFLERFGRHEM